jgi:hypothetical protein
MGIYIAVRFDLKFGVAALLCLFHDTCLALAFLGMIGGEFEIITVAAFLMIIGYSINDTVVIYDRVRENAKKVRATRETSPTVINRSLNQTLSRTILTGGCVMIILVCLIVWGGEVINDFAWLLLVGSICGTYSTLTVVPAIVLAWNRGRAVLAFGPVPEPRGYFSLTETGPFCVDIRTTGEPVPMRSVLGSSFQECRLRLRSSSISLSRLPQSCSGQFQGLWPFVVISVGDEKPRGISRRSGPLVVRASSPWPLQTSSSTLTVSGPFFVSTLTFPDARSSDTGPFVARPLMVPDTLLRPSGPLVVSASSVPSKSLTRIGPLCASRPSSAPAGASTTKWALHPCLPGESTERRRPELTRRISESAALPRSCDTALQSVTR